MSKVKAVLSRKQKQLKEHIIDHYFPYGELMQITEDERSVTLEVSLKERLISQNEHVSLIFLNKKKEIMLSVKGHPKKNENGSYLYQFDLIKCDLRFEEYRRNYYLSIQSGKRQFRLRYINGFDEAKSIEFFENDHNLFFIRRDRHQRLFLRTSNYDLLKVCDLPNFLESIIYRDEQIIVEGELFNQSLEKNVPEIRYYFAVKKSNKVYFKAPITITGNRYNASIPIDKNTLLSKGKWGLFIVAENEEMESDFPVYVRRAAEEACSIQVLIPTSRETISFRTFIINGKIFVSTSHLDIEPNKLLFNKQGELLHITIKVESSNIAFHPEDAQNISLRFRQRDTNGYYELPLNLHNHNSEYHLTGVLPYRDLTSDPIDRPRRWDVFIGIKKDENYIDYRIRKNGLRGVKKQTSYVKKDDSDHYESMFYPAKHNKLSFVYTQTPLLKYIDSYSVDNGQLILKGKAFFRSISNMKLSEYELLIVLVNRRTEEEIRFKAERDKGLFEGRQGFKAIIPIGDLQKLVGAFKEILDFYLLVEGPGVYRKVKLGLKDFKYYKDELLKDFTAEDLSGNVVEYNMTTTPRGNLKLESFVYEKDLYTAMQESAKEFPKEEIWLVGERPDTAQDNGYRFFEYCRKKHPDLNIYYAIDSDSPDKQKLQELGQVLEIGSREHIEKSIRATVFIGTHDLDYILPYKGIKFKNYREGQKVFLQHGVLGRKNVPYHKKYYKYPFNVFIVSSDAEKDMVVKKFGYLHSEVAVTGLARFDKLWENHHPKNEILLIPTWREWISSEENLINSSYYHKYLSFITSEELADLLEKYDLKLNFYPHYRMQQYIVNHVNLDNPRIKLVEFGDKSVQALIKDNRIMITDYSSVSFDFTYLGKPVIYYHFDPELFFASGILRPIEETFLGDIVSDSSELVQKLEEAVLRGFKEREDIIPRKEGIFSVIDERNNERIMDSILDQK
ncbi:CDP-glycerol glycerophosphotransferase family protein [Cytobacillus oceanisediminis]|uniref:CDP-glycerol glycerophosphotransferase family protein n=1 Tax=Cytobacillus oceanisediminis TaxID=665099 RepID=UPI001D153696|nr:CDP-glycerol glycerophosphotransferase family protein [Cytobacillus oceanisediminis]MCC3648540.1 CDP-glycerol glycerophosphotransferase family protein [Cytobacillus oceanisediminis]